MTLTRAHDLVREAAATTFLHGRLSLIRPVALVDSYLLMIGRVLLHLNQPTHGGLQEVGTTQLCHPLVASQRTFAHRRPLRNLALLLLKSLQGRCQIFPLEQVLR